METLDAVVIIQSTASAPGATVAHHMVPARAAQQGVSVFSPVVTEFWDARFPGLDARSGAFALAVDAGLSENRRVMVLDAGGTVRAVLTPSLARAVGVSGPDASAALTESDFRRALSEAGVALHGADHLHYLLERDREALLRESAGTGVRALTEHDAQAFAEFESSASPQDLDDAYVELDHWAVFGAFVQDRLVSAASAYPWLDARIADIGVLTLPGFRGRGHGRAVVRALCKFAAQQAYQPQYRCQFDNEPSKALAASAGLTFFGKWEVVSQD